MYQSLHQQYFSILKSQNLQEKKKKEIKYSINKIHVLMNNLNNLS